MWFHTSPICVSTYVPISVYVRMYEYTLCGGHTHVHTLLTPTHRTSKHFSACMRTHTHSRTCTRKRTRTCIRTRARARAHAHAQTQACRHMYTYTYTCMCTHAHSTRTHTHTHKHVAAAAGNTTKVTAKRPRKAAGNLKTLLAFK